MAAASPRLKMFKDSAGLPYFYDRETGETSWSPPTPASGDVKMDNMNRSASHEGLLLSGAHEFSASLEQPPQLPPRKLSAASKRAAKRKQLLTTLGKNLIANIGNIAVILTIAILANQIRQDLNNQQREVAELRDAATNVKAVLKKALNTTQEITVQATALQAKISLFEALFSSSHEDELQKLLSDLRAANASLSQQIQIGTGNIAKGFMDITSNTTSALSSIQSIASATSSSLQALNSSAVSDIQTAFSTSLAALQTLNASTITTQASLLNQTQATAVVSNNISARVSALEQSSANLSSRVTFSEQASSNISARVSSLEQVSTSVSSRLTTMESALRANYTGTVYYCGATSSVNGGMGGFTGAAQICSQQFPSCGSTAHMCTAQEMLQLSFRNTTQLPDIVWIASGVYSEYATSNRVDDCYGYTSAASRAAANWAYNTFPGASNCGTAFPIACCAYRS